MAAYSMATLLNMSELVGIALHNACPLSSQPAFPSFACTSRLGVTSIPGSTTASSNAWKIGLWIPEANRGRNGGCARAGSSGGGGGGYKGFDDGDIYSDLLGKMNPLEEMQSLVEHELRNYTTEMQSLVEQELRNYTTEMQSLVEQELRNYTTEMQRRAVAGELMDSLSQGPKRSRSRTQEQRSDQSVYTRNPSNDGLERRKSTTFDNIGDSIHTREDREGDGF